MHSTLRKIAVGSVATLVFGMATASADHVYMTIEGQKQGKFAGEVRLKGREQQMSVSAVSHEIASPRDIQSGLPTGKRQHKPLVVTKAVGAASPQIFAALVTNENLKSVVLQFVTRGARGEEVPYYTIKLTDASISSVTLNSSDAVPQGARVAGSDLEEVAFTYQKIEVQSLPGGASASDSVNMGTR